MTEDDIIYSQEKVGKKIVQSLVSLNLVFLISLLVMNLWNGIFSNWIGLTLMIILSVFIYKGTQFAKWAYIVVSVFNLLPLILILIAGKLEASVSKVIDILTILMLLTSLVTCLFLMFSGTVKEFMYKQRG